VNKEEDPKQAETKSTPVFAADGFVGVPQQFLAHRQIEILVHVIANLNCPAGSRDKVTQQS
jgi:hypothetical protein